MLKKIIIAVLLVMATATSIQSQVFNTRTASIHFFSKTPLEDIDAENKQVYAAVDLSKKTIAFSMLLKGFLFKKDLMQEHFNENYVESDKYPKATFAGTFEGDVNTAGNTVKVNGKLTLHGVEKEFSTTATLALQGDQLTGKSNFQLVPEDFNITIPGLVRDKIAKQINVEVQMICKPVK